MDKSIDEVKEEDVDQNSNHSFENSIPCKICNNKKKYCNWIECSKCKDWFHLVCVRIDDTNLFKEYHCTSCVQEHGPSIMKKITNSHRHDRTEENADNKPTQNGSFHFIEELKKKEFAEPINGQDILVFENAKNFSVKNLVENGFNLPIIFKGKEGLKMNYPSEIHDARDLLEHGLDLNQEIDIIDVHKQKVFPVSLEEFVELLAYSKIPLNSISLELSNSELSHKISPPQVIKMISWAEEAYKDKDIVYKKPPVEKYCLISMKDSYTDFHIDFSGTSVWYHVVKGEKIFYFIKPTSKNLEEYEKSEREDLYHTEFLPDKIGYDNVYKIILKAGHTLLLPTGYIHGVLTPLDSLVFGGNFLNSFNASLQIRIFKMEERLEVAEKLKYPNFKLTHWLSISKVWNELKKLREDGIFKDKKISPKDKYYNWFMSFKEFHRFTYEYYDNLVQSIDERKLSNSKLSESKLEQNQNEKEEFEIVKKHNHKTSLDKMKKYLDSFKLVKSDESDKNGTVKNDVAKAKESPELNVSKIRKITDEESNSPSKKLKSEIKSSLIDQQHCQLKDKIQKDLIRKEMKSPIQRKLSLSSSPIQHHHNLFYKSHNLSKSLTPPNSQSVHSTIPTFLSTQLLNLSNTSLTSYKIPKKIDNQKQLNNDKSTEKCETIADNRAITKSNESLTEDWSD